MLLTVLIGICVVASAILFWQINKPDTGRHVLTLWWPYEDQTVLSVSPGRTYHHKGKYYRITRHVHTTSFVHQERKSRKCIHIYGDAVIGIPEPQEHEFEFESQLLDRQLRRQLSPEPEPLRDPTQSPFRGIITTGRKLAVCEVCGMTSCHLH